MTQPIFHTCPTCALEAWITADGRVILTASARPADHRWLELPASAQNWLAELLRVAHDTQTHRPA